MNWYTYYDPETGRVGGCFSGDAEHADANTPQGMARLDGKHPLGGYVQDGRFVAFPARPSQYHHFDYDLKQWVYDSASAWGAVRAERNRLLAESDWTQLPDVPTATRQAWATYRQALRDITKQPDPLNIVWPSLNQLG